MKGLLLKDWYVMAKQCRMFLVLVIGFAAMSISGDSVFFMMYPVILLSMIATTLIAYDERFKWMEYSESLPYSRAMIVSEKYVLCLLVSAAGIAITLLAQIIRIVSEGSSMGVLFDLACLLIIIGLISPSIILPLCFWLGMEKARIAYFIVLGAMCAICFLPFGVGVFDVEDGFGNVGMWAGVPVVAVIFAISWVIAIKLYEKREL